MPFSSRLLRPDDLSAVVAIAQSVPDNTWSMATFQDCFKTGYVGWVVEVDAIVQGFLIALVECGSCQLMHVAVRASSQRQGVGRHLLDALLRYAKRNACHEILLEVRRSNLAAIRLYESVGFEKIGTRRRYYSTPVGGEDAWVYRLMS